MTKNAENKSRNVNEIITESNARVPEESGQSKRKRVPQRLADVLNGCLCGLVLNSSLIGVLKCKQASCETQWVSISCWR